MKTETPSRLVPRATFSISVGNIERLYVPNSLLGNMAVNPTSRFHLGKVKPSELWILDLGTGEEHQLQIPHDFVYAAYSGDGTKVVLFQDVGEKKRMSVVDLKEKRILSQITSPSRMDTVSIDYSGNRVASGSLGGKSQNALRLWNAIDGSVVAEVKGCGGSRLDPPRFSDDGRSVLVDCGSLKGKPIKLLRADTGQELLSLTQDDEYPVPASRLSPDGSTIVSVYRNNGVRVWDAASGTLNADFVASQGSINQITFTRDSKLFVTNGFSPVVRAWVTRTGEKYRVYETGITKSPSFIVRTAFNESSSRLAGVDKRGRITVWDTRSGGVKFVLNEKASKENLGASVFFGHGDRIFVRHDTSISLFDAGTGKELQTIPNQTGVYYLNADGTRLILLNPNNSVTIWSAK